MKLKCKLCKKDALYLWEGVVLSHHVVKYFFCSDCEFLFTEEPFWLNEAYSAPIVAVDTGLLMRNNLFIKKVSAIIHFFLKNDAKYLDYAGGYGVFTRLMRDAGYDFYWNDPYAQNLFAQGFAYDLVTNEKKFSLVTSFESFEHFVDPIVEIEKMFQCSDNILFSTELLPNPIPRLQDWWYYVPFTGQHIAFYRKKTLLVIAQRFGKYFNSAGGLHMFSKNKISESSFRRVIKYSDFLFDWVVSRKLHSKTFSDFQVLSKQILEPSRQSMKKSATIIDSILI